MAVDLSEFEEAARGPGVIPGSKVDKFLNVLDDDQREKAVAALHHDGFSGYTVERVFRQWARDMGYEDPPGHTSVEKWRERECG